jgi:hypothetical protein
MRCRAILTLPVAALALACSAARGLAEQVPTIAQLLQEGWEVVGYTGSGTTFILLRHKDRDHLVQCTVLYDTTRGPSMAERVRSNCYEVR